MHGDSVGEGSDMDKVMSDYYGEDQVAAIITIKVDTKEAERIATEISKFELIEDVFLVTGDTDIVAKARFANYAGLKDFVLKSLAPISGIKETKTLMVVTTFKERGVPRVIE
ncbi:MAG: Lrp/AsnC family transcriptional regulator [Thermoplasmata archaeon]